MNLPNKTVFSIGEWSECFVPYPLIGANDRRYLEKLKEAREKRFDFDFLEKGLRIFAKSWVGVLSFERVEVQIHPKLAGDNVGLIELLQLLSEIRQPSHLRDSFLLEKGGNSLLDLLIWMFLEHIDKIVRSGLVQDYVEIEEALPVVRGRILITEQYCKRLGVFDKVVCRYEEQLLDTLDNQLLHLALSLSSHFTRDRQLLQRIQGIRAVFVDVSIGDPERIVTEGEEIIYHLLNQHYREAHALALLLLKHIGIADIYERKDLTCFAFLIDMNDLFQQLVTFALSQNAKELGLKIASELREYRTIVNPETNKPKPIRPDVVISNGTNVIVFDAKYKLYDDGRIGSSDIYQLFIYSYVFDESDARNMRQAWMVYPSEHPEGKSGVRQIRTTDFKVLAQLQILGIHIPTVVAELRARRHLEEFKRILSPFSKG